ncbi:MAG: ABC transporter ATP-binding protein [Gammaproteobacteria bacterium]|nr:ABC transporter ATP-binding protein [Pseudomonadota bacterium]TDJ32399.1 MAG: ABC transporter ATP-binding protein [Gammaproteobacteria bacterium]
MLILDNVRLTATSKPLSHEFRRGRITVVLGRNGAGKTRLCRLVAGLDACPAGDILIGGERVNDVSPGKRSVALVYQEFVNYASLTVEENIASPLRAAKRSGKERQARVREIATQLQLTDLLSRYPEELSGGQQQRVAIGRALAKSAKVLVLDEPLVNLDYKLRESLELQLRELLLREALTVIYTSSDPRDAFNLADDLVLLHEHQVVQTGEPLDVYQRPVSPIAADLMSDPGVNRLQQHGSMQLVRPEHLSLEQGDPTDVAFPARLLSYETSGSETYLHCAVESEHWIARLDGLHELDIGAELTLYAHRNSVLRFEGGE